MKYIKPQERAERIKKAKADLQRHEIRYLNALNRGDFERIAGKVMDKRGGTL